MNRIINLDDYKEKKNDIEKLNNIELTREERIEANNSLLYDDDEYILQMMIKETNDLKEM